MRKIREGRDQVRELIIRERRQRVGRHETRAQILQSAPSKVLRGEKVTR
jgi:hypothetical protein